MEILESERTDIEKGTVEYLREWGFDMTMFEARAKKSIESARGDISEITAALRQTLLRTKQVIVELQKAHEPVAAEIKRGFERGWNVMEESFIRARLKTRTPELEDSLKRAEEDPNWWS